MEPTGLSHRDTAIEAHLPLVRSIARRYAGRGEPLEDLVQAGTVGLIKAVDRYDPERHRDLAALARPSIEGEIRHHLRDGSPGPRVGRLDRELATRVRTVSADLTARLRRAPTVEELAAATGAEAERVTRALAADAAGRPTEPLPEIAREDADADAAATEARVLLETGWASLDERERRLLTLRYHEDRSQSEIARELGLSQAHVSRLLRATLHRLRAELAPGGEGDAAGEPPRDARSGRLLLRLPRTLHGDLARAAEREGVPLNTYITTALAASLATPRPRRSRLLLVNAIVVGVAALTGLALLLQAWLG
ncbi:MAG TPA: sigma-70 family RNA polymerase sigma factor [Baekduia sp.]|uniref:sigma-70 family RNA polymerase sigma factor n=1 Tax=Baekduia sp. TaxID=2600305 RepID=UPI002D770786|nr:sigma-70 family RNA polymerase sigma factor [Baekduia sp.]HET6510122.1 sigma-70 family RNA polymerase sigma factor [Baekduia sp.]